MSALEGAWVAIKNVTTVAAVILAELDLENLLEQVIGNSNVRLLYLDLGPLLHSLRRILAGSRVLDLLYHVSFDLFNLCADSGLKLVLSIGFLFRNAHTLENFLNKLANVHSRNVVVMRELLGVVGFTAGRWTGNEDLDRLEAAECVELGFEHANLETESEAAVPLELLLFLQRLLLLLLELLLLLGQRDGLEGLRGPHAQIDGQLLLPAVLVGHGVALHVRYLACAEAL